MIFDFRSGIVTHDYGYELCEVRKHKIHQELRRPLGGGEPFKLYLFIDPPF